MTNVIVLFPKIEDAKNIRNLLVRHGFRVSAVCTTGAQAPVSYTHLTPFLVGVASVALAELINVFTKKEV